MKHKLKALLKSASQNKLALIALVVALADAVAIYKVNSLLHLLIEDFRKLIQILFFGGQ